MKIHLSRFLQWGINVAICRMLGWRGAYAYISFLARIYFFFRRCEIKAVRAGIGTVFAGHKSPLEMRNLSRKVVSGIISHYYEKFFNAFSEDATTLALFDTHIEADGLQVIGGALRKGRGALLVTGHFGGVEFIPGFLGSRNIPVAIVVKFASERLRRLSVAKGEKFSITIIDADRTPNILKAISENLKQNRIVITQCDEIDEWRPSRRSIRFLGQVTPLDKTIDILSKRLDSPILFGLMHRKPDSGYTFIARSTEQMAAEFFPGDPPSVGRMALKFVERYIYQYPEEWYQWKKFALISAAGLEKVHRSVPAPLPVLKPSMGKSVS